MKHSSCKSLLVYSVFFSVISDDYVIIMMLIHDFYGTIFTTLLYVYLNRGSYMSAHVLLNLLNKQGNSDKM